MVPSATVKGSTPPKCCFGSSFCHRYRDEIPFATGQSSSHVTACFAKEHPLHIEGPFSFRRSTLRRGEHTHTSLPSRHRWSLHYPCSKDLLSFQFGLCSSLSLICFQTLFLGPGSSTPFSTGGPEAFAAVGDQSEGALWLCLEGSADERLCRRENLPHTGECDTPICCAPNDIWSWAIRVVLVLPGQQIIFNRAIC